MNIRSINFLIILLTVASTFFIGETDILASNSGFSMTPYLEKCGGKIYSKCDSSELNQKTIFEFARKIALQENKKLMVVIGADWCPSCLYFSKMVANDPDKKELFDKVILVEINGDTNSAKDLEKKLQFSTAGYPQAFIFEGSQNEIVQWFFPSSFKNIKSLVAQLDLQEPETQIIKPSYIGQVSVALLEKPIDLIDSYGVSNFLKNPKNQSDYYINQGVAALHVFHYVDAYRSFRMAAQSDPYSIMAYVGQIISIMQIGYGEERSYFAQQALKKINGINQNGKTSKSLTAWIEF